MDVSKRAVRWLRSYWDEEDGTFFCEADDDGWVLRQIELSGPDKIPAVAAALAERPDADRDGLAAVQAYEAKYGARRPADYRVGRGLPARRHRAGRVRDGLATRSHASS